MLTTLAVCNRVARLTPSVTVAVTNRAKQLKADGVDVLGFAAGEPDFDTPAPIKAAAIKALQDGQTKYMPTLGDAQTRAVIARKLLEEDEIQGLTPDHVAISAGGKHALFVALHCLLDPPEDPDGERQEVIYPVPAWVSYRPITEIAGGRVVEIETTPQSDFKMTPEQLADAITPRSRVLIINSPNNPCATMYSPEELRQFAAVVAEKAASVAPGLIILSDEIYEKITFGQVEQFSIGAVPEVAERTLTLNGLSKSYAMTGWRIGYTAMPGDFGKELITAMGTLQGQMTTNITSFNYPAIRVALTDPVVAQEVEKMRLAFARRAEIIYDLLTRIPGIRCPKPTGAFYAFPDVSALFGRTSPGGRVIGSALDLSEALLEEALIAVVPGEDFGGCGGDCIRISFACGEQQIVKGMERFAQFVEKMR